jgi:hypothetical protein
MNVKGTEILYRYSFARQWQHKLQTVMHAVKIQSRTVMARRSTVRLLMEACLPSHYSSLACSQSDCSLSSRRDIGEDIRRSLPTDDNGRMWGPARKGKCIADCKPRYIPVDN